RRGSDAKPRVAMVEKPASKKIDQSRVMSCKRRFCRQRASHTAPSISLKSKIKSLTTARRTPRSVWQQCSCDVQKTMCRQHLREPRRAANVSSLYLALLIHVAESAPP